MDRQNPPQTLLEESQNLQLVFEVGERLFAEGLREDSLHYYECVLQNETNDTNFYYVMSAFRVFLLKHSLDAMENLRSAIQFEPVLSKIPEQCQLDALLKMLRIYFTLHLWKDVDRFSDRLHVIASRIYHDQQQKRAYKLSTEFTAELPLVYYYGFSYLAKSTALQKQGDYTGAKEYVAKYAELGWFNDLDDAGREEVERFRLYAKANAFTLDLLSGNVSVLPEYITFLEDNPEEILPGMVTVMESANLNDVDVDDVLAKFNEQIRGFAEYEDYINRTHYFTFLYQLAIYYTRKSEYGRGLENALQALELCHMLNNNEDFKKCVALIEKLRGAASPKQHEQYQKIVDEVFANEKSLNNVNIGAGTF
ncbi:DNA-binding protein [Paenibacillus alvei]|uniref:DNA-binding protein n=1 Tax=Paenibacillus alvei TaxID=44250 RepID=UPI00227FE16A|nr:DNA-binding protein [Paenibacillus alvei]MCY7487471.1 DNA-binding protein [Paenibacillus alvei]